MIQKGSTVIIHYTLQVAGETIESSRGAQPFSFVQGAGEVIPGLEKGLEGLNTGDKKKITVSPEDGYGQKNPETLQRVPRTMFENIESLEVGNRVRGQQGSQIFQAVVMEINENDVLLDFGHPLAGKVLEFDIEVMNVLAPAQSS